MMMRMRLLDTSRSLLEGLEDRLQKSLAKISLSPPEVSGSDGGPLHRIAVTAAWVVGGLGVLTVGLIAGRELRGRYKLKRRTPYDYYAHSGDRSPDLDYSVGI